MFVLTLVHGTWGRGIFCPSGDAPWTCDKSVLCSSLRDRLGPDLIFRRFRWSGTNSHTSRIKAAEELRGYLWEGLECWPDATHLLIAHSHGGNVALAALDTSNLQEKISGMACLATPFISARERDIGPDPYRALSGSILALIFVLLWKLNMLDIASWTLTDWVMCVLGGSLFMSLLLLLVRAAKDQARKLRRELTPRLPNRDQLLIIRSPADEASGALVIFQFISQLTVRIFLFAWSWYARLEGLLTRYAEHKRMLLIISVVVPLLATTILIGSTVPGAPVAFTALIVAGTLFLVSAMAFSLSLSSIGVEGVSLPLRLLVSVLLWPVIATLSILILPFGWQAAVANIFLDITAETTPIGSWEVHSINPPTSEELGTPVPPLMHKVYENPSVLRKLEEWISEHKKPMAVFE